MRLQAIYATILWDWDWDWDWDCCLLCTIWRIFGEAPLAYEAAILAYLPLFNNYSKIMGAT
jgi:hypothetical protein